MRIRVSFWMMMLASAVGAFAAPKSHVIAFGKATTVKWFVGAGETTAVDMRVRPLIVDAKVREITLGNAHDVTERLFVVRRAFRVNDALPAETASQQLWKWVRGGWLVVDRLTGRITPVILPEFDPYFSTASWYRDYAAYCGVSEDSKNVSAVVMQLGRRKPLLRKAIGALSDNDMPDTACTTPVWQRKPPRVTFDAGKDQKFTFTVRGHALDTISDDDSDSAE